MPDFQYTARELSGQQVTGTLAAPSKREALTSLANQQLFPLNIHEAEEAGKRHLRLIRGVAARHLVTFYTQLADLLQSGVPLLRSLELLERQSTNGTLRMVVQDVREHVADGSRLAEAMRHHPQAFSELAVSMVRAGEEGSFLEDVLKRIAAFTEHQQELKSRVVGSMIYPIFLLVAMTIVVSLMLIFFVPKFEPVFEQLSKDNELPWATVMLMSTSEIAQQYWVIVLMLAAAAGYGFFTWIKSEEGRHKIDAFRIRAWGLGPVVRSLAIARFCRILGTLLRNGVPILQSLNIAKDATGNVVLSRAIGEAAENISEGKSLAAPLAGSKQFPEDVVEMISVGEEANNLEQVLIDIADSMERRTNRLLDIFVRMLEPVMLTIMAGIVLFVVVALLYPILKSSTIM